MIREKQIINNVAVVSLAGSLDMSKQAQLRDDLVQISRQSENDIVLDLSHVNFIDSSCLGALVSLKRDLCGRQGDIKLSHLTDDVRAIFQITHLDKIFEIYDNIQTAVNSFFRKP